MADPSCMLEESGIFQIVNHLGPVRESLPFLHLRLISLLPRQPREGPEVIDESVHANLALHYRRPLLHHAVSLQSLERVDTVEEGLERGLVEVDFELER